MEYIIFGGLVAAGIAVSNYMTWYFWYKDKYFKIDENCDNK